MSRTSLIPVTPLPPSSVFVTFRLGKQRFGIPISHVKNVMRYRTPSAIPFAPTCVTGMVNLDGQPVTCLDLRIRLGISVQTEPHIMVTVEHAKEPIAFIIDTIDEALTLEMAHFQPTPATVDQTWRDMLTGVFALERELLLILDPARIVETAMAI